MAAAAVVALIGWYDTPAVAEPTQVTTELNIHKIIKPSPKPNYEAEVLVPLRQKQAEAAAQKAAALAEQQRLLEQKRAEELARTSVVQAAQVSVAPVTGDCRSWMAQAGITDMANAYTLIMKESGCNPNAVNASSGACGIGQQLPCGKWPHQWNDPVGGMIDMQSYVMARYGSWANALAFHRRMNWY